MPEEKQKILDFLKTQYLGVISTIDLKNNKSESALVAFAETENLEIIVGTSAESRKFENIKNNPEISFVFGFSYISVQYEGTAQIAKGDEVKRCEQILIAKNPKSQKYALDPNQRYFKITPRWIRYTDYAQHPDEIFEVNL